MAIVIHGGGPGCDERVFIAVEEASKPALRWLPFNYWAQGVAL
ncbi:hypothetical protein IG631_24255 [Alternaria alternata]|nr:hypothetical protein IG631_24255 [Alternaria alternata]